MNILATIKEKILEYLDVHIKLLKLNVIAQTSNVVSYFLFAFICLFMLFGIVLFIGFGITEGFIALGLPRVAAYFLTVAVYILSLVIIIASRKKITGFFSSGVITAMTGDSTKNKEEE